MSLRKVVGILGAGIIGTGVAQCAAVAEYRVILVDVDPEHLARARRALIEAVRLHQVLGGAKVRLEELLSRITFTCETGALSEAALVVEAIPEKWVLKQAAWRELSGICSEEALLASSTSAIPITRLASVTRSPERVLGLHFMNPVPLKPMVEMVRAFHTSAATLEGARAFLADLGKTAVMVADSPGFVSNRVLMLTLNEAIFLVHERVAAAEEVDRLFKGCFGHRMGPLETADLIGLDTVLQSLEVLQQDLGEGKFRPCPLLRQMVEAGLLGRKNGRGFYNYPGGRSV